MISIPRVRIKAQTRSYDGSTMTENYIPDNSTLIRAGLETVNVVPGTNTNIFTSLGLSTDNFKMNRRYTLMTAINITESDPGSATQTVTVNFRPDNRNQWSATTTFSNSNSSTVTVDVHGHVNYETGVISWNAVFTDPTDGGTYVANYATISMRFVPVATMNGRTKVVIETELTDVTIDQQLTA